MNSVVGAYVRTDIQKFEVVINSPSGLQHLMVDRNLLAGSAEEQVAQFREIAKEAYIGERVEVYLDDTGQFVEVVPRLPTEEALAQGSPIPESVEKLVFTDTTKTPFDETPPVKLNKLVPDAKEKSVKITRPTTTQQTDRKDETPAPPTPKSEESGRKSLLSITKSKPSVAESSSDAKDTTPTSSQPSERDTAVEASAEQPKPSTSHETGRAEVPATEPAEDRGVSEERSEVSSKATPLEIEDTDDTLELRKFCVSAVANSNISSADEFVATAEKLLSFLLKR